MSDLITIVAMIMVIITLILVGIAPIYASRHIDDLDEQQPTKSQTK